ncbi:uncharacterized protein FIBRA_05920 [Fibroporia radiculosa]|uniref:Uncharacterized protein n=1 Tax=Fibroporia radiculosa TaxID=599839 RepID=J4GAC4_9APHY|nr:uncharacterized protein FIBRA_05920 [Fibroporia radiculosa]CCM03773.1 predicted protein [Fibroporia radiculosa]
MSSSLLGLRKSILPLRVAYSSVRYAGRKESMGDPKHEIIRRALYPSNIRNGPSPTGTWRPDVGRRLQRAIPSAQAHETIERAWLLHQRHRAMEVLRELDPKLYLEANKEEDPRVRTNEEVALSKSLRGPERKALEARVRGLFPRELRIPSDTPSRSGWNYDWTPIIPRTPRV